ncbi:dienelactone hydrolase family protein [Ideonella azotifigens]|uniref:Dienelactone hydrolase family protein n=1 Tax=Ideonella azotifigens TaxID=513160 RepID=A0ABN1KM51_9BURK|nr:dienelactone hydrolase family protein [Ideonella azotifigens]MCD2343427.1 dienelactone hydrolase family protein [Ideonella azotifigens]
MGHLIEFKRADGRSAKAYCAEAPEPVASVVVIQEWWGINDQIRGVADRLAAAGFTALVPDLYKGKSTVEQEEAHHLMTGLDFGDAAANDVRGAVQHLKAQGLGSGKVGVTGYCMGGALSLLSMVMAPEADAAVVWYGYPPLEFIDASKIGARPLMAHWATQDQAFALSGVDALEAKLKEAQVPYEGYRYLAQHAFANETAVGPGRIAMTQYDAAWAQLAWDRTLRFFGQQLG